MGESRAWLVCYVAGETGQMIVRGRDAKDAIMRVSGVRPTWNNRYRGWLTEAQWVHDLCALANREHQYVTVSHRPPKA